LEDKRVRDVIGRNHIALVEHLSSGSPIKDDHLVITLRNGEARKIAIPGARAAAFFSQVLNARFSSPQFDGIIEKIDLRNFTSSDNLLPESDKKDPKEVIEKCYECQRRIIPFAQWNPIASEKGQKVWAWTSENGKKEKKKEDYVLEQGWDWAGPWRISKTNTDKEGWRYAMEFKRDFHDQPGATDLVRKRCWKRKRVKLASTKPGVHFGVSLDNVPKETVDGFEGQIPTILVRLKNILYEKKGLEEQGIFRVAASKDTVGTVKSQLEGDSYNDCEDVHCIAALIKQWFRELPTPLLTDLKTDMIQKCVSGLKSYSSSEFREEGISSSLAVAMSSTLAHLQQPQRSIFEWLLDLCVDIWNEKSKTLMPPKNLAIVFAPNLFPDLNNNMDPSLQQSISMERNTFIEIAIQYRKTHGHDQHIPEL